MFFNQFTGSRYKFLNLIDCGVYRNVLFSQLDRSGYILATELVLFEIVVGVLGTVSRGVVGMLSYGVWLKL